jgi:hypothetical protein
MSTRKNPALLADSNRASMIVKATSPDSIDYTFHYPATQINQCVGSPEPKQQDRIILHLCHGWALGFDQYQWMVMRAKKRGDQSYWNPEAFIATTKRVLLRVLSEKTVQLTPAATAYIEGMPDKFREWLLAHNESHSCQGSLRTNDKPCRNNKASLPTSSDRGAVQ